MKKISLHGFGLFSDSEHREEYAAGEVVFETGDYSDKAYVVLEGTLRLTQGEDEIDVLSAGDLFGEMGMVENRVRNSTVTAVTDSTLVAIDRLRFASLVRQHPGFATRVMAIISSRLARRTEQEVKRRSFQRELEIGRKMQRSLLPQSTPVVPGWQFAAYYETAWRVGGDFYDFISLEDDPSKVRLVIADVTGKGVPAALYMAVARTMIRAETFKGGSPAAVLGRVNEHIISDTRSPLFLSAIHAILNYDTGVLRYANAGHNQPLCFRQASGEVEELPGQGYLLGAFADVSYENQEIDLNEGDALVMYTDGVTDARDAQRRFFGDERLKHAVAQAGDCSADEMAGALVTAVAGFSGPVPQTDDQTILVVKRVA